MQLRTAALLIVFISARGKPAGAEFPQIRLEPISQNEIVSPVGISNAGDGSNRLFVTDQRGTIQVIQNGSLLPTPFLDIESRLVPERANFDERGLLGLAFHPDFGQQGAAEADKFYVYYSAPQPNGDPNDPVNPVDHQSVVAEYAVTEIGSNIADPNSERVLLTFDQPQFNHDAGYLGFGPDGMLYITTGDGGGGGDNEPGHTGGGAGNPSGGLGNSQDRSNLLGKVLRIDVDGTNGPGGQYGVPGDNPFVGEAGVREEIYAYGLRNPWRASFDNGPGGTGRLFVADVGQGDVEEINIVEAGGNYGWRVKEGTFDFDNTVTPSPAVPLLDPVAQYAHPGSANGLTEVGLSITSGVVYRGDDFPALDGKYLFGDWSNQFSGGNGTLLGLEETSPGTFDLSVLDVEGGNPIGEFILAFGLDEHGEAYVATKRTLAASALDPGTGLPTGTIYRIGVVPEPSTAALLLFGIVSYLGLRRWNKRGIVKMVGLGVMLPALSASCQAATLFHVDDFQSGTTAGWSGGASPTNQASGGPAGADDRFLQITSRGGNGPGSRLATFNNGSDWTGDYAAAGIEAITVDLMNPATSSSLEMRLVLFGPDDFNNRWTSTDAIDVPNDGEWENYEFPLTEADLTRVRGTATYDDAIGDVVRVMLRHDQGAPSRTGSEIAATLNMDNLQLVPETMVSLRGDFDGNGDIDVDDLDMLVGEIAAGESSQPLDLSGDGKIDGIDLDQWLTVAAGHNGIPGSYISGDANLDGSVDSADLNHLALNWGERVARWSKGDFTADGIVNAADLNELALNWQQSIPVAAINTAVPEPSAITLVLLSIGFFGSWRRCRVVC